MAVMNVNPNRMELLKLKRKLATAIRGHKLLKDKLEGLLKDFMSIVKEYVAVRMDIDGSIGALFKNFILANATIETEKYKNSLSFPKVELKLEVGTKTIMNVKIPEFKFSHKGDMISYSFYDTDPELDTALSRLRDVTARMVKLSELEKTVQLMSIEIEKTRRRVNALEYIMIPRIQETIKMIENKLDELERGNITRLMKIKDILSN